MSQYLTLESRKERLTQFLINELYPIAIIKSLCSATEDKSFYFIFSFLMKLPSSGTLFPKSFFNDWETPSVENKKNEFEVSGKYPDDTELSMFNASCFVKKKNIFISNNIKNIKNIEGESTYSFKKIPYLDVINYKANNGSIKDFQMYLKSPFQNKCSFDSHYTNCYDEANLSDNNILSFDAPLSSYTELQEKTISEIRYFVTDIYAKQLLVNAINKKDSQQYAEIALDIIENIQSNSKNNRFSIYRMMFAVAKIFALNLFLNKFIYENEKRHEDGYYQQVNSQWFLSFPDDVLDNILRDNKQAFYYPQQVAFLNKLTKGIQTYSLSNLKTSFILKQLISEYYCAEFSSIEMRNHSLSSILLSTNKSLTTHKNILTPCLNFTYYNIIDYFNELENKIKENPSLYSDIEINELEQMKSSLSPLVSYEITSLAYKKHSLILVGKPAAIYYLNSLLKNYLISNEDIASEHNVSVINLCRREGSFIII